eukprot:TRINITY_DN10997_c0_g1_i1.p2 TRINITY_DN10997_c0_g1~~TRINITY_DN10997_c0_g1_i1.p2  ORF type:complete len:156 (+),score=41.13 TRINITY_DN10997_c0_g1_i1:145-612(+)
MKRATLLWRSKSVGKSMIFSKLSNDHPQNMLLLNGRGLAGVPMKDIITAAVTKKLEANASMRDAFKMNAKKRAEVLLKVTALVATIGNPSMREVVGDAAAAMLPRGATFMDTLSVLIDTVKSVTDAPPCLIIDEANEPLSPDGRNVATDTLDTLS